MEPSESIVSSQIEEFKSFSSLTEAAIFTTSQLRRLALTATYDKDTTGWQDEVWYLSKLLNEALHKHCTDTAKSTY